MNPDDPAAGSVFEPLTEAELNALELRWYEGRMLRYAEWLGAFVQRHRAEILLAAHGSREPAALLAATKRVIAGRGSVHMAGELTDQRGEIENELWYRGERGDHDRRRIQLEWTAKHAAAWRRWRIKEYFFVTDRSGDLVVAHLLAGGPAPDANQ
jgi:hypothetical protein